MTKIETVIFDAGGVLHASNSAVSTDLKRELGIDDETLKQIWANHIPALGSGNITEAEFWELVRKDYGIRPVYTDENLLGRAFEANLVPFEGVGKLVKELGLKGVKTAVLSNTIEPHARALRKSGLYADFTGPVMLSHEVGFRKPGKAIYKYAIKHVGSAPSSTIFVDDDPENVDAAKSAGMHGVVFTDPGQLRTSLHDFIPELDEK